MIPVLVELAVLATAAYLHGWRGALLALACVAVGHVTGHVLALASLRRAGYVVEYRADGRGVRRWRIGVERVRPPFSALDVEWIVPGEV